MKVDVTEFEKQYTFTLEHVTQLCGLNIVKKTYVLESIRRYFGTHKYQEERNKWRDNVKVDDETIGRKYFSVVSVKGISDLLTLIKWSKQSLMMEYVKQLMQKFEWQAHLRAIHIELERLYQMLNDDLQQLGGVELTYDMSEVWDMVQKSSVVGSEQVPLEDTGNAELITIFLNLIEEIMKFSPKKMLVLVENIDHLVSSEEYDEVINKMRFIGMNFDVYFIVSTSIDGYVKVDRELCNGITVFGDVDFQMPGFDKILQYINEHYPVNKQFSEERLYVLLEKVIHRIGQKKFLYNIEENVVCKLINQTLMLSDQWGDVESAPELAFLRA